jgi:exopolysaccharide biosynthesis WecB/TagA/CpsF family protein
MAGNSIGLILIKDGLITQDQLDKALKKQRLDAERGGWKLLGQILMESRCITQKELKRALKKQEKLNELEFFTDPAPLATTSRLKRALDILGATVGLVITAILLPFLAILIYLDCPGPILISESRVGLRGKQFKLWQLRTTIPDAKQYRLRLAYVKGARLFNHKQEPRVTRTGKILRRFCLDKLPQFWNVLKGEMSLVGVRPILSTLHEVSLYSRQNWQRLSIKPGMTGLWQISKGKRYLNFEKRLKLDVVYIQNWNIYLDIQILLSTLFQIFGVSVYDKLPDVLNKPGQLLNKPRQVDILNVTIDNFSIAELLEKLESGVVLTPNVDHLMKLQKDREFYEIYSRADYKICDSQILIYAARFLGTPLKEKISGSDFFPLFCEHHRHNEDMKIFLLGGADGVADRAKSRINNRVGREIIIAAHSPSFGFEKNEQECLEIVERINQTKATVLAIGVGAPKQEKWIYQYKHKLTHVKIFLAVGATIDFEAGSIKRAPKWMSQAGVEWLFRITCDPRRLWKRYLIDDLPFFWLLLKQKFGLYSPPAFSRYLSNDITTNPPKVQMRKASA